MEETGPLRIGDNPWLWLTWCPYCGIGDSWRRAVHHGWEPVLIGGFWRRTGHHGWEPVLAVRYDRVRGYKMTKRRADPLDVEALARHLRKSPPRGLTAALTAAFIPELAKLLVDPDKDVRRAAADALGELGPAAAAAAPDLARLLEHPMRDRWLDG